MKSGTKVQILILLLLFAVIYSFRLEIMINAIQFYALKGHPHSKRLLGEYYAAQANEASAKAAFYFQQALEEYKIVLPGTPAEQRKWIEYLIGNQYECGKGVAPNLEKAKFWYQQAVKNGLPSGKTIFDQIKETLQHIKLDDPNKEKCVVQPDLKTNVQNTTPDLKAGEINPDSTNLMKAVEPSSASPNGENPNPGATN